MMGCGGRVYAVQEDTREAISSALETFSHGDMSKGLPLQREAHEAAPKAGRNTASFTNTSV